MSTLAHKTFNEAVLLLHGAEKVEALPEAILSALATLYGEALIALFWQGFLGQPFASYYRPENAVSRETEVLLFHYAHEHPTYNQLRTEPVATSDLISEEDWKTTQQPFDWFPL